MEEDVFEVRTLEDDITEHDANREALATAIMASALAKIEAIGGKAKAFGTIIGGTVLKVEHINFEFERIRREKTLSASGYQKNRNPNGAGCVR